jgi:acyl-CoA reductase-like NAD-dependent aldehyde dehydrogenase
VLLRWADGIETASSELALLNCLETGRSKASIARDSIPKAVESLRWFASLLRTLEDRSLSSGEYNDDYAILRREPVGVVGAILPWNDPLVTFMWKVAPALAMGNSVVVKPSEHASIVIAEAISIGIESGVPSGALQLLLGDGSVGAALAADNRVGKIAFTGSTSTASRILTADHHGHIKRYSFECGGKGHFIYGNAGRDLDEFARVVAKNMF